MMTLLTISLIASLFAVVEGRVTSARDGEPLVDASVVIDSLGLTTRTDADGAFRLTNVPAGRWELRVEAEGHRPSRLVVRVPAGGVRIDVEVERLPAGSPGQEVNLIGVLRETGRREPIRFGTVEVTGRRHRAETGEDGFFSLGALPVGEHLVRATAPGYRTLDTVVVLEAAGSRPVELAMHPAPFPLPGVRVGALGMRPGLSIAAPEAVVLDSTLLDLVPAPVERDVLRALHVLPSTTPSSDYSSALFVRGGTPDQTRLLLDGAPIYNPYHLGGFVSSFTPSAVAATILRPGGLPADAPSGLSGALEVQTRDGGRDSLRAEGSVGLLSSQATVDGPLPGGSGAWLLSARRTYIDAATSLLESVGAVNEAFPYGFFDVLGKVTHDVGALGTLTGSVYANRDGFDRPENDGRAAWGSDVISLRYRGLLADRLRAEVGVATSGFGGDWTRPPTDGNGQPVEDPTGLRGELRTWALDAEVQAAHGDHSLFAGARWERTEADHAFHLDERDEDLVPAMSPEGTTSTLGVFLRDRWDAPGPLVVDGGLRLERVAGRRWYALPRGRVGLAWGDDGVSLAAGRYIQDTWSMRNEESGFASIFAYDLPTPTPSDRPLQEGWDAVLEARMGMGEWRLRGSAFVKRLSHVPTSPVAPGRISDAPLVFHPDSVRQGELDVEGVEVQALGSIGRATLSLAYRWQREERTLGGVAFPPRTHRPHRIVAAGSHPWGEREVSFALSWMSGLAYTPVASTLPWIIGAGPDGDLMAGASPSHIDPALDWTVLLGPPNSARLPSYLRLDLDVRGGWDWSLFGREGVLEPYLSVLNVLGSENVLWAEHRLGGDHPALEFIPQFPLVPSFGVRWRF